MGAAENTSAFVQRECFPLRYSGTVRLRLEMGGAFRQLSQRYGFNIQGERHSVGPTTLALRRNKTRLESFTQLPTVLISHGICQHDHTFLRAHQSYFNVPHTRPLRMASTSPGQAMYHPWVPADEPVTNPHE